MTYSIVARDPETGQLGVAVQSHFFSTGAVVPWAEAGVGAVATQATAELSYGPLGLALMRGGLSPAAALQALLAADPERAIRQVAMVDDAGSVAAHTGDRCIPEAGHATGDGWTVQANMMRGSAVPEAMAAAYQAGLAGGFDLADRLLAALDAAEAEGGDIRGRQSAALLVVAGQSTGRPWEDRVFDLRVEDHPDPLGELRRLTGLRRAYRAADRAERLLAEGRLEDSVPLFEQAHRVMGDNPELTFWYGVVLAAAGQVDQARPHLEAAFAVHDGWAELLQRLPAAGLFPDDPALLRAVLPGGTG